MLECRLAFIHNLLNIADLDSGMINCVKADLVTQTLLRDFG